MELHGLLLSFGMKRSEISFLAKKWVLKRLEEVVGTEKLVWSEHRYGKPCLLSHPECFFNMAHSGQIVILVIDKSEVGVDVEFCRPREYEALAERFFHPLEREWIQQDRENRFYEVWTAKEAYLKAIGIGLRIRLAGFSMVDESGSFSCPERGWNLFPLDLSLVKKGYKVCVCGRGTKPLEMTLWEGESFTFGGVIRLDENNVMSSKERVS